MTMIIFSKIRRMYFRDKLSINEIARRTSLSRNTVKKWLRMPTGTDPVYKRQPGSTKLSPFEDQLKRALIADSYRSKRERQTALKLLEELQKAGYEGGYRILHGHKPIKYKADERVFNCYRSTPPANTSKVKPTPTFSKTQNLGSLGLFFWFVSELLSITFSAFRNFITPIRGALPWIKKPLLFLLGKLKSPLFLTLTKFLLQIPVALLAMYLSSQCIKALVSLIH